MAAHSLGGVAIIARKSLACSSIIILSPCGCSNSYNISLTICFLYIPPDLQPPNSEFEGLGDRLPEPFVLTGALNARNHLWGSSRTDARGRLVEKFVTSSAAYLKKKKKTSYVP